MNISLINYHLMDPMMKQNHAGLSSRGGAFGKRGETSASGVGYKHEESFKHTESRKRQRTEENILAFVYSGIRPDDAEGQHSAADRDGAFNRLRDFETRGREMVRILF